MNLAIWKLSRQYFCNSLICHDDVIKWKHFLRYWSFVRGIHRPPIHLMKASDAELCCLLWPAPEHTAEQTIYAGDLRRHRTHYDVTLLVISVLLVFQNEVVSVPPTPCLALHCQPRALQRRQLYHGIETETGPAGILRQQSRAGRLSQGTAGLLCYTGPAQVRQRAHTYYRD